jgi:uncharacterized protein involved in exopolysaccharide biosynthesis
MTEQLIQTSEADEYSLLDILVTLAESWKLLVFGPVIAGLLGAGLSFLLPKTYESVAIVRLSEEEVPLLHAAPVLDPLIEKFDLLAEADGVIDDARQGLKKRLTFTVDKKTKLATVTVKARAPDAAQALCSSAIAAVLKELQIKGQEKALIEKTIAINDRAIASAQDAVESIQRSLKRGVLSDQALESATKNLAAINQNIAKYSQENEELIIKLAPRGREVFVQEASLPQRKASPKSGLVVLLAVLASVCALLVWVFLHKAWLQAAENNKSAEKLARIKVALGVVPTK